MTTKSCLFLKASAAACAKEEGSIRANVEGLGFGLEVIEWVSADDFQQQVVGKKFDIIYLGAHADGWGFGETTTFEHDWQVLGNAICCADCMIPEGTLFLGCCRGGMKTVALKILKECDKIDYICVTGKPRTVRKRLNPMVYKVLGGGDLKHPFQQSNSSPNGVNIQSLYRKARRLTALRSKV